MPFSPKWFYVGGVALAAHGLGSLVWLCNIGLRGKPIVNGVVPGVLLLAAGIVLLVAEARRRGRLAARNRGTSGGGGGALPTRDPSLVADLVWMLVPLGMYVALVLVPVLAETSDTSFGATLRGASEGFWVVVSWYGCVAAGIVGLFLVSVLKRATSEKLVSSRGPAKKNGRAFWWAVSREWRGELWFAFASTGLLGLLPLLWHDALAAQAGIDDSALATIAVIALSFGVLAMVVVLNGWRSGTAAERAGSRAVRLRSGTNAGSFYSEAVPTATAITVTATAATAALAATAAMAATTSAAPTATATADLAATAGVATAGVATAGVATAGVAVTDPITWQAAPAVNQR